MNTISFYKNGSTQLALNHIKDISVLDNLITIHKNAQNIDTLVIKVHGKTNEKYQIIAEENANAKIIFEIVDLDKQGEETYHLDLLIKNNAHIKFLLITDIQNKKSVIEVKSDSKKDSNMEFIGGFVSNVLDAKLDLNLTGRGASLRVRTIAVSALNNNQALDVKMTHHAPDTIAEMTNIAIASENGIVRLNGVGKIEAGMKNANAYQTLKGIITNDKAQIDVNPILIIDEFDVKAGHAATVGRLEEDVLYYLRSRGLSLMDAQKLIITGFLQPVIDEIDDEAIKERVVSLVEERI